MKRSSLVLIALACAEVPETPTWTRDVQPILVAHCGRCHGGAPYPGVPTAFRLDVYQDTTVDGRIVRGAFAMAEFVAERAARQGSMPPSGPSLSGRQKDILTVWWDQGAMLGDRPENQRPSATILTSLGNADTSATMVIDVNDPDRDVVLGDLLLGDHHLDVLHSGRNQIAADVSDVAPGNHPLRALITDDLSSASVDLASVNVAHASGNTAPTVRLATDLADAIFADRDGPVVIAFVAADPDPGDVVRVEVEAFQGSQVAPISVVAAAHPEGDSVTWDMAQVPQASAWRLRLRASDGTTTREVESAPFIISHATTTASWDTVKGIFLDSCSICHPGSDPTAAPRIRGVTWVASSYEDLTLPDREIRLGVHAMAGRIFRRTFERPQMPPPSAITLEPPSSPLSAHEPQALEALENWLLAGAPR